MPRLALLALLSFVVGCGQGTESTVAEVTAPAATPNTASTSNATASAQSEVTLVQKNYDGLQQLIAMKKGKLVVVDAWSTYCEPCMREFPGLVALHKKHGDKIACISLCANYDGRGKPDDVMAEPLAFLKAQNATFDNVLSTDADNDLYQKLDIVTVPTILVYDREGKLLKKFEGEPTYATIEEFVVPLLN